MKKNTYRVISWLNRPKIQVWAIPLISILCSVIAGSFVILAVGGNPVTVYHSMLQGGGVLPKSSYAGGRGLITDFLSMMGILTPMIFAALGVAVALRCGLFAIGISGQMLISGFLATVLVGYSPLSAWIAKPLVLLIGMIAGGLCGAFLGFLKVRFNINEVVSSIMCNYILQNIVSYFIISRYTDTVSRQSLPTSPASRLTLANVTIGSYKMDIPLMIPLAIVAALLLKFFIDRTITGFELRAVGSNPKGAKYAGIGVGKSVMLAMSISGVLAGLAGVTLYLGYYESIQPKTLSSIGFDSIAVSLLGNSNPVGILLSSLLITVLSKGSTYMSSVAKIQQEIASVIIGLILLFSACGIFFTRFIAKKAANLENHQASSKEEKS
jgi:simple sugar transport system permease protein